ncbi:Oidioi.mRNA.OKI2018_I69.PAR.g8563.t1.cds [Oikopleura dioica]|uniref:Oidioi.mRNA.OKI2018_I69.PAR.g8563.t1.cds n=1 Tax=Oikopleura dioica TaxID=34765 RepID=A0ABN7RGK1_OIKDI|nr:Oidioi.mRNA.OKI2018_I69.PAR.g8563.t1.cds [Oikopleura dioica]
MIFPVLFQAETPQGCVDLDKCAIPTGDDVAKHMSYAGTISTTRSGRKCQQWRSNEPHAHYYHKYIVRLYGEDDLWRNYCRNPNGRDGGAWCYTTDPNVPWEYCDIPDCPCVSSHHPTTTELPICECASGRGIQTEYVGAKSVSVSGNRCRNWVDVDAAHHWKFEDNFIALYGEKTFYCSIEPIQLS